MIDEIADHQKTSEAILMERRTYKTYSGVERKIHTTRGWELYIQSKDGFADWIELKDFKESYPVELATYAEARGLMKEPAFAWWAPHVLKKKRIILSKVKSKYWEWSTIYSIQIPKTIAEAKKIDDENGNTLWMDAVWKEMGAIMIAFEEYEGDT